MFLRNGSRTNRDLYPCTVYTRDNMFSERMMLYNEQSLSVGIWDYCVSCTRRYDAIHRQYKAIGYHNLCRYESPHLLVLIIPWTELHLLSLAQRAASGPPLRLLSDTHTAEHFSLGFSTQISSKMDKKKLWCAHRAASGPSQYTRISLI